MPLSCRCSTYMSMMLIAAMSPPLRSQISPCGFYLLPDRRPKTTVPCPERVDTLAAVRPTVLPVYPEMLLGAHVEGTVLVQFVVTARGQIDTATFGVLKSTHDLFTQSVRAAMTHWTARAARLKGKSIAQWAKLEVDFDSICPKPNRTPKSITSGGW